MIYNWRLKRVALNKILRVLCFIAAGVSSLQLVLVTGINRTLHLPDKLFVVFDEVLLSGLQRIALMPIMVLAARLCPKVGFRFRVLFPNLPIAHSSNHKCLFLSTT